jgi:NADPH:quinone reductase-like Zn-dependent oxidoreductase
LQARNRDLHDCRFASAPIGRTFVLMTMKAVLIRKYGGPEVLELADVPAPEPKPNEVVVDVKATSVNPVDWLVRDGGATSFVKVHFPVILGCDLAGTVSAVGATVTGFSVGDEVFAMMPHDWGAHAEKVAIASDLVVKKPKGLSMIEAAALPVVAMTAFAGLKNKAELKPGEHVLVNGASGGVGQAAVQIAKALGAEVTAVCSKESFDLVRSLGADHLVDYKTTDFTKETAKYDVVFDAVGKKPYAECKAVLKGRAVHVTTTPGISTFLRQFANPIFHDKVYGLITTGAGKDLATIKELVEAGKLKPIIDKVYPFAEVAAAEEYSKGGRAKGKIVLEL